MICNFTAFDPLDFASWIFLRVLLHVACLAQLLLWFFTWIIASIVLLTPFNFFAFCGGAITTTIQWWTKTPDTHFAFCGGAFIICALAARVLSYNFWLLQAFCSGAYTLETPARFFLLHAVIAHSATHITGRHQLAFCTGASQWWTETPDTRRFFGVPNSWVRPPAGCSACTDATSGECSATSRSGNLESASSRVKSTLIATTFHRS